MGGVLITILTAAPLFAVLIWLGLACGGRFADSISRSRLLRLARGLELRVLAKRSALLIRLKIEAFIGRLKLRELPNRLKSAAVTCRIKSSAVICRVKSSILNIRSLLPGVVNSKAPTETPAQFDMDAVNCRVRHGADRDDALCAGAFTVEICGTIHSPYDRDEATLKITMLDITGAARESKPVWGKASQWRQKDSGAFCYSADLGRLTGPDTMLQDWMSVARLQGAWLVFPRRGKRNLLLQISIISRLDSQELARGECVFAYDNEEFGYIDVEENLQRAKTLAVALAFTVSASDGKMFNCEVDLIKDWARNNICLSAASNRARRKLDKALDKTFAFFRDGRRLNTQEICRELVEIGSPADMQDVMDLCLHVAQAKGSVAPEETSILSDLARWLEIGPDVYRGMMDRTLPINMHEVKDAEVVLGVTSDMSEEKARRHLNREYSKWNARVTNCDPQIQAQADEMLSLIAEARQDYVG